MSFISLNDYLYEAHMKKDYVDITIEDPECRGEFKYREYDDGTIVDLGGRVDVEHRNSGVFKCMFSEFTERMRHGNTVYLVSTNPILNKFLEREGYVKTDEYVRYWGKPSNGIVYKKVF
jgi:hypothetical protein